MKKFMTAVTAVSLSAMMLAGCGKTDVQETTVQESTTAETEAATETESETKVYPDEAYLDGINLGDFVELGDYQGRSNRRDGGSVHSERFGQQQK